MAISENGENSVGFIATLVKPNNKRPRVKNLFKTMAIISFGHSGWVQFFKGHGESWKLQI